jgi:hypothetical protein
MQNDSLRSKSLLKSDITLTPAYFIERGEWSILRKLSLMAESMHQSIRDRNYKIWTDLLGGQYWLDMDQLLRRYFDNPISQNDWIIKPQG